MKQNEQMLKNIWFGLAIAFCFMVTTHQAFWCPIHGDGAFYSFMIKNFAQHPSLALMRPSGDPFFDHPYFFFWWSWPFVKLLGYSDLAIKSSNFAVAGLTLWLLIKLSKQTFSSDSEKKDLLTDDLLTWSGYISCLVLMLMEGYELQTRQPSLDPLAHFFAIAALFVWFKTKRNFLTGLVLGLAFLTKGLEMLPHLGALIVLSIWEESLSLTARKLFKNLKKPIYLFAGVAAVVLLWALVDYVFKIGWFKGYYSYQFAHRFLNRQNFEVKIFDLSFFIELIKVFQPWLLIALFLTVIFYRKNKKIPVLWMYNWIYVVLVTLAFSVIKKDSSQHYTGIYVLGAINIGQGLVWAWTQLQIESRMKTLRYARGFLTVITVVGLIGSLYFWTKPYNKNDIWSGTQNLNAVFKKDSTKVIVIDPESSWQEQIFWNGKWYWPNPIFWSASDRREIIHLNQEIFIVRANSSGTHLDFEKKIVDQNLYSRLGF